MKKLGWLISMSIFLIGFALSAGAQENSPPQDQQKQAEDGVYPMKEVVVTGKAEKGYTVKEAATATKTDTPIMETPVSVQVVTQQVMQDQQAVVLEDALKNVSGIQRYQSWGKLYDNFTIRGFPTDSIYSNGFRVGFFSIDMTNIDRVEVLKGPAAILYGRTEPGGIINLVPKAAIPGAMIKRLRASSSRRMFRKHELRSQHLPVKLPSRFFH